jgi:hypothetical protein
MCERGHTAAATRRDSPVVHPFHAQENLMSRKTRKQTVVRKPTKKILDPRRVRYGSGMAPAHFVRSVDTATHDSRAIRFGSGMSPASLRK